MPLSQLTCPWPLCGGRPHSWVSWGAFVTLTDSSSLLNMQIGPVAPPWLALRWKSTDTSICLVKGSEGAGGWGRREESWGENRQIGVTVSCEKSFRVWCMCGANYATSACVKKNFFLIWNIFIWWHFFPTCLRDFKGFGDCITLAVSHYSSVTHVQHTGSERQPAHELKNAYRWMKWLWKGHIARFCVRLE